MNEQPVEENSLKVAETAVEYGAPSGQPAPRLPPRPAKATPPPLNAGDHLTRAEFERRYEAHPEIKKAELIDGIVYIASAVHFAQHAEPHADIVGWLGIYCAATPGVCAANSATVRLDYENEVQPDALLRLEPALGGRARITADDYLAGPPDLVVEVAASSAAYDLHVKRRAYQNSGVPEYLALQVYEQEATWFVLRAGAYAALPADDAGILRSERFPGLWLNVPAFWAGATCPRSWPRSRRGWRRRSTPRSSPRPPLPHTIHLRVGLRSKSRPPSCAVVHQGRSGRSATASLGLMKSPNAAQAIWRALKPCRTATNSPR